MALLACKLLARELPEALARSVVRTERLVGCVLRVGGDLLRDGAYLAVQRVVMLWIAEQGFDPRLVRVVGRALLFEEQLAEQEPDADVRERPERQDAVRRADELLDLGVLGLDLRDDVAARLADQGQPDFLSTRHTQRIDAPQEDFRCLRLQAFGIRRRRGKPAPPLCGVDKSTPRGQLSDRRARQAIWAATTSSSTAKSFRNVEPEIDSARAAPPCAAAAAAMPITAAPCQRTLPYRAWRHVPTSAVGMIASSDVPVASCCDRPSATRVGTKRMPPPTPNIPASTPAARPSTTASTYVT